MAKKFGGFTPQQQQTLLSKMGYTGPAQQDDINKFMMSSPKAASMMGKYAQMAKARVAGGPTVGMAVGGMTPNTTGGFATGAGQQGSTPQQQGGQFNSMEELMEFQKKYPSANLMGEYQRLQQQDAQTTPNPTGGPKKGSTYTPPAYDPATGLPTKPEESTGFLSNFFNKAKQDQYNEQLDIYKK